MINNELSWKDHTHHIELLKEFYHFNKYYLTESMKDTFLDAIECMEKLNIDQDFIDYLKEHGVSFKEYFKFDKKAQEFIEKTFYENKECKIPCVNVEELEEETTCDEV